MIDSLEWTYVKSIHGLWHKIRPSCPGLHEPDSPLEHHSHALTICGIVVPFHSVTRLNHPGHGQYICYNCRRVMQKLKREQGN